MFYERGAGAEPLEVRRADTGTAPTTPVATRQPRSRPATMLRPSSRTEARKKGFKKATDADEARRKREEGMIQIRKDKREEAMLKKRR